MQDADGGTSTETFALSVGSVDDPPSISAIADATINEDATLGPVAFTLADPDTSLASIVLTATSSNTAIIPNANIVLGGSGANRTVTVTPIANANGGPVTITIAANDGVSTVNETFDVTVTSINDLPTITPIADQSINEDGSTSVAFTIGDVETAAGSLTVIATSSNTALVPNANLVLGGSGASRTLAVTPLANAFGTATISVQVTDANGGTVVETFDLTVASVNDLPTITAIADQSINEDGSASVAFTIGDVETAAGSLTVAATSSNTALVPNANLVLGGSGASRTLAVTPVANAFGTATISVQITDADGGIVVETFELTVTSVNDLPTITPIADQSINEDGSTSVAFTIGDVETAAGSLTVTATSSNTALVPNANLVLGGSGASRTLAVTPLANAFGAATISVQVTDANGGSVVETFELTVTSVNDLPTITAIADQAINEDGSTSVAFTIGDVETAAASLTIATTSSNTALVPNANLVLGGSGASRTLAVTPVANASGTTTITVQITDADGGIAVETFELNVITINDLPTITAITDQSINEDGSTSVAFTIGDVETAATSLTVVATSNNPALIPNANLVLGGSGASRTLAVTPLANAFGSATISVQVTDGNGGSVVETFDVVVASVNDGPTITAIADLVINEDSSVPVAFIIGDVETAADSLTIVTTSSNTALVPAANIVLSGTGTNRSLTITPAANAFGTTTISVEVKDANGGSVIETFDLTVTSVNDGPTITAIADQFIDEDTRHLGSGLHHRRRGNGRRSLLVAATSSNSALVPNANLVLGGTGASRTLSVTPVANASGTATITIEVKDADGATVLETFDLVVTSINDLPTITAIADQSIAEDSSATVNFTIGDIETAAASLTVTATSSNQAIVPAANLVLGGSGAARTLSITPANDAFGTTTITVEVKDANGGTVVETFDVTVGDVNDPPTISAIADQSVNEDGSVVVNFTIGDFETAASSLTVTPTSSNVALVPNASLVVGGIGASRSLTVTPAANAFGTATISVEVKDANGASVIETFELTVVSVNDLPTISDIANQTVNEDASGSASFTVGDIETAAGS